MGIIKRLGLNFSWLKRLFKKKKAKIGIYGPPNAAKPHSLTGSSGIGPGMPWVLYPIFRMRHEEPEGVKMLLS